MSGAVLKFWGPIIAEEVICRGTEFIVDNRALRRIEERVNIKLEESIRVIYLRTWIYLFMSIAGILYLWCVNNYELGSKLNWIVFTIMFSIGFFLTVRSILSLKQFLFFMNDFDAQLYKFIDKEVEEVKGEGIMQNLAMQISRKNNTDVGNLVISHSIRIISRWFRKNKWILIFRIVAYSIIILTFESVIGELIK
jgi:hypothetical protein